MEKQIIRGLLQHLRGSRSQVEISKYLGFNERDYHKWEAGYKEIRVSEFNTLSQSTGRDFYKILFDSIGVTFVTGRFSIKTFFQSIDRYTNEDRKGFLEKTGFSKAKWWRLLNEVDDPHLCDVFRCYVTRFAKLSNLLLAYGYQVPEGMERGHQRDGDRIMAQFKEDSWLASLIAALEMSTVAKDPLGEASIELLERLLRRPQSEIRSQISDLIQRGVYQKTESGIYKFDGVEFYLSNNNIDSSIALYLENSKRNSQYLIDNGKTEDILFSYRVVAVSEKFQEEFRHMVMEFGHKLLDKVDQDQGKKDRLMYFASSSLFFEE